MNGYYGPLPFVAARPGETAASIQERRIRLAQQRQRPGAPAAPGAPTAPAPVKGISPTAREAFTKAIDPYRPGGEFGKGVAARLERGRTKALATGMQSLVGAGLAGTTLAAGLGKKYEEEVAAPTMAGVESERAQRLSALYAALGGAEQAAVEAGAGRQLGYAQLGLGYAQLGARETAAARQVGVSRTGAPRRPGVMFQPTAAPRVKSNGFRIPTTAPSLFEPTPTAAPTMAPFTAAERTEAERAIARTGSRLMTPEERYQGGWTG